MNQSKICDQCTEKCPEKLLDDKFKKYRSIICEFLESVGLKQKDAIICGSMSLYCQDMPVKDIHDIDIELPYSVDLTTKLSILAKANPSPNKHTYPTFDTDGRRRIDFVFQGVQFNAWLVPDPDKRPYMWMDYLRYASIMSTLKYKFGYAREKDYEYYLYLDGIFKKWLLMNKDKNK